MPLSTILTPQVGEASAEDADGEDDQSSPVVLSDSAPRLEVSGGVLRWVFRGGVASVAPSLAGAGGLAAVASLASDGAYVVLVGVNGGGEPLLYGPDGEGFVVDGQAFGEFLVRYRPVGWGGRGSTLRIIPTLPHPPVARMVCRRVAVGDTVLVVCNSRRGGGGSVWGCGEGRGGCVVGVAVVGFGASGCVGEGADVSAAGVAEAAGGCVLQAGDS